MVSAKVNLSVPKNNLGKIDKCITKKIKAKGNYVLIRPVTGNNFRHSVHKPILSIEQRYRIARAITSEHKPSIERQIGDQVTTDLDAAR